MTKMPPALLALALCAFSIGTTELVIVGLLPEVSADLGVTIPAAGMLVTGYALGVVFGGPVVTAATMWVPKKALLIALMGVFVAGNAFAAVAPGYASLMAGRVVSSLAHGAFFGVAIPAPCRRRLSYRCYLRLRLRASLSRRASLLSSAFRRRLSSRSA